MRTMNLPKSQASFRIDALFHQKSHGVKADAKAKLE